MAPPSVALAKTFTGDKTVTLGVTPSDFTDYTVQQANFIVNDNKDRPTIIPILDIPSYVQNGVTIPAVNNLTTLSAGSAISVKLSDLQNGVQNSVKLQLLMKNTSGDTSVVTSSSLTFTPSGPASAPVFIKSFADPDADDKFTVRLARHTSDGGSKISNVMLYLSAPKNLATNAEINNTLVKVVDYSPMYTATNVAGTEFPAFMDIIVGSADGVLADMIYEVTAVFANATAFSPLSEPIVSRPRVTCNKATALVGTGSDGSVTVNGTTPNNTYVANVLGLIAYDQNVVEEDRLAPKYYAWNGASFTAVLDKDAMGTSGFPMVENKPFSFIIDKLLNNVIYNFKVLLQNVYGAGDLSDSFGIKAKQAPSAPNKPTVQRFTPSDGSDEATAMAALQNTVDSTSKYARVVALKFLWEDPLQNYTNVANEAKFTSSTVSMDATAPAAESALRRFVLPYGINGTDARTGSEALLSNDTVLASILQIAGNTSLSQWNLSSAAQKLSICGGSTQMREAMTIYYNVLAGVKSQVDLVPVDITDWNPVSQSWSRTVYTVAGSIVKHSVVATIVDGAALITSPAAVVETRTTDDRASAKPNILSATARNGDVEITLDRMLAVAGWINVVYNIKITDSTGNQQTISYTPQRDQFGDAKKVTSLYLGRDLGAGFTNGTPVTVTVGSMPLTDPITGDQVNFAESTFPSSLTPKGQASGPSYTTFVDQLTLKFQLGKVTTDILDGATLNSLGFTLIKNNELPLSQVSSMTASQIATYIGTLAATRKLSVSAADILTGLTTTGDYQIGYNYLITSADATAKKNFWQSMSISAADGAQYYLLAQTVTTDSTSTSAYVPSGLFSFFAPSGLVQNLSLQNNNGALTAKFDFPTNDGFGSATGANIKDFIIELWSNNVMKNSFTTTALSYVINSGLTNIGTTYTVKVYVENNFTDLVTGANLKSAAATSSDVVAAAGVQMQTPIIQSDGRSILINSVMNGSKLENVIAFVALSDGSDRVRVVPTGSLSSNISISAADFGGITAPLTIVSGMVVSTDSTSNGIGYVNFPL